MEKEHPRIVSLVPSWTETLYSWGFDAEVVGVTRWCVHPRELVARATKVGGTKDPDVARILEMRPDLVVCEKEENRREDVEALQAGGLTVFVSEVASLADSLRDIKRLGEACGRREAASVLAQRIEASLARLDAERPAAPIPVFVPIWRRPWMTLTRDTYAHSVLERAGAHNIFADAEGRYPERGPEEAIEAGARAALLPTEPYPFHAKEEAVVEELVEAGFPRARIRLVDGEALTWYGARAVDGVLAVGEAVRALSAQGEGQDEG